MTIGNIVISTTLNLPVFIYYQILTLFVGILGTPFKKYLQKGFENILIFWLVGFNILTGVMALSGLFWRINAFSIFLSNIIFLSVILFKRQYLQASILKFIAPIAIFPKAGREKYVFFVLFLCLALPMFFSCMAPPTKIDELTYSMYFTKKIVREGSITMFYSPYETLTHMAVPIFNAWFYWHDAEYAPALNSFLYYIFSVLFVFWWTNKRFGKEIALISSLITA